MVIGLIVVDDQPEFCQLVREVLALDKEFSIIGESFDGPTAVEMVAELKPDVVLLDVEMPDQHGLETASQLRARFPAVKVVLMSAYHEKVYRDEALRTGAVDFIPKVAFSAQRFREACEQRLEP